MADADGKMWMEKQMRITKKVRGKKRKMRMAKKEKINKQTIKERNLSFKSLHTERDVNSVHRFVS